MFRDNVQAHAKKFYANKAHNFTRRWQESLIIPEVTKEVTAVLVPQKWNKPLEKITFQIEKTSTLDSILEFGISPTFLYLILSSFFFAMHPTDGRTQNKTK